MALRWKGEHSFLELSGSNRWDFCIWKPSGLDMTPPVLDTTIEVGTSCSVQSKTRSLNCCRPPRTSVTGDEETISIFAMQLNLCLISGFFFLLVCQFHGSHERGQALHSNTFLSITVDPQFRLIGSIYGIEFYQRPLSWVCDKRIWHEYQGREGIYMSWERIVQEEVSQKKTEG